MEGRKGRRKGRKNGKREGRRKEGRNLILKIYSNNLNTESDKISEQVIKYMFLTI
jgi:hypothetical protein